MTGFEPRISGVGSDRSTNCATTTAKETKTSLSELLNPQIAFVYWSEIIIKLIQRILMEWLLKTICHPCYKKCDQIGRFIVIWAKFKSLLIQVN